MFPEYGAPIPLWPGLDYPISPDLERDLISWNEYYDALYHWEDGWSTSSDPAAFWLRGRELCARVQAELGDQVAVTFVGDDEVKSV